MNFESVSNVNLGDNNGPQDIYNRAGERSLSQNDIPQRLVVSPVIELPFGKGKHWLTEAESRMRWLGGWELGILATLQSGSPFGPTVLNGGANILETLLQTLRPNLIWHPVWANIWQPAVGIRGIQYLNPAAFAVPALFTYGSQARTLPGILGPGTKQMNLSFSKNQYLRERYRFQIRAGHTRHLQYAAVRFAGGSFGGSNFGIIDGHR